MPAKLRLRAASATVVSLAVILGPNNGIVIGANGVTLDLNGHTIDGRNDG